jgi:hypothetical protein
MTGLVSLMGEAKVTKEGILVMGDPGKVSIVGGDPVIVAKHLPTFAPGHHVMGKPYGCMLYSASGMPVVMVTDVVKHVEKIDVTTFGSEPMFIPGLATVDVRGRAISSEAADHLIQEFLNSHV